MMANQQVDCGVARAERLMRGMGAGVETETGGDGRW
jgi:hypothetical protein